MKFFETTVAYTTVLDNGKEKKISPKLLIDTLTYGHAEEVAMKWIEENAHRGERKIKGIVESSIDEINTAETEADFYLAKVSWNDGEKDDSMNILVDGDNFNDARANLAESIEDTMADTEVLKMEKSKIIEIIYPNRDVEADIDEEIK